MRNTISSLLLLMIFNSVLCQEAKIYEEALSLPTYPFSDPDPVAKPGKIYPYFRFDGYSTVPENRKHKMVVMENNWIKVWISPDMGGKVYGALDKKTGKYFIYFNNVVKFREIAMRGPWTSGGIEFNFGSIGHAPTTATPVDYFYRKNHDGSVSCFIGAIELTSRTEWRVEITLPSDKAWFETRSYWENPSNQKTSLYHWQTAAADATDDLKYYFPGKAYIDHSGNAFDWPVMPDGRDISYYRNNNYRTYHSYHVLGEYTDWFAGYYNKSETGFGHWSRYPLKPGKKIWIWGLSRQGEIWKNLLTDSVRGNTQYTEIQTGLLFNQEADGSTMSPFKHLSFMPGAIENFNERWYPISKTGGIRTVSQEGILNIEKNNNSSRLVFQSLVFLKDTLQITDSLGKQLKEYKIDLTPEQIFEKQIDFDPNNISIRLKNGELVYEGRSNNKYLLERPLEMISDFNWESVYGLYIKGVEKSRQRLYSEARLFFENCIKKDPDYLPAYTGLAEIDYRELRYDEAEKKVLKVLGFDTYDPDANFIYGNILLFKKQYKKAMDAFGVSMRSPGYKSPALYQLAIIALKQKRFDEAWEFIFNKGLINENSLNTYKTAAILARLRNDNENYNLFIKLLSEKDPLCHMASFEKFFTTGDTLKRDKFISGINTELKYETYIELALWYLNAGLENEALEVMKLSPPHPLADLLTSFLAYRKGDENNSDLYLKRTFTADDKLVFPFRHEYEEILKWAETRQPGWKLKYYSAIFYWGAGRPDLAETYFNACADNPDSYSFYLTRGSFLKQNGKNPDADYLKALKVGANYWRTYHTLHGFYMDRYEFEKALSISARAMRIFGDSYIIKFDHAQSLLVNGKTEDCLKILSTTDLLPREGANYARIIWRQANILEAVRLINAGDIRRAMTKISLARTWPENLGVGRPYETEESLENLLEAYCYYKSGKSEKGDQIMANAFSAIPVSFTEDPASLAYVIALRNTKKYQEADSVLAKWSGKVEDKVLKNWASKTFSKHQRQNSDNMEPAEKELELAVEALPQKNTDILIIQKINQLFISLNRNN